jgi:YD repeat-containing protein
MSPIPGTIDDSSSETATYTYDTTLGNVTSITTPGPNGTTTVSYNYTSGYNGATQAEALGEPLTVTASGPANGGGTTTTAAYYAYDGRGNVISAIDSLGNETDSYYTLTNQLQAVAYPPTAAGRR